MHIQFRYVGLFASLCSPIPGGLHSEQGLLLPGATGPCESVSSGCSR
jgi:hypothetical protein